MPHLYANNDRQRKRGATRQPRGQTAPPKKRGLPWLLILSLLVLAGFGYGLYQLAGVQPDPAATQAALQAPAEPAKVKLKPPAPAANNPAAREEGYRFYTLLPDSEVVPPRVEAYDSTPREQIDYSRFLLQAGSFRDPNDADSLRAKLLLKGLPNVTTSPATSAAGTVWYRVRVGPFESRSRLNKAQDVLVRMNLQPMQVTLPQG